MSEKTKKFLKTVSFILVDLCLLAFLLSAYVKSSAKNRIFGAEVTAEEIAAAIPEGKTFDCILVLGCGVQEDGTPAPMLQYRLDKALELYKAGASKKVLVSGDHGTKDYDEVNMMKRWLTVNGVPSEDVFMDHAGFSTYETIYRAKEIFGVKSAFVVTQEYHLFRAMYDAMNFGIDAVGVPAKAGEGPGQVLRDLREVAARVKDMVFCGLRPSPKYLGDPIPITGNGDITNDR